MGIFRCADYINQRAGLSVYLLSISRIDATFLEHTFIDYREDGRDPQAMVIVDHKVGRARISNTSYIIHADRIPVSLFIKGLKRLRTSANKTKYLADMVGFFEERGTVTAARLNYEARSNRTQNTGFITFLSPTCARNVATGLESTTIELFNTPISISISDGVPLLVSQQNKHLLTSGLATWSDQVETANLLIYKSKSANRNNEEVPNATELATEEPKSADSTTCVYNLKGATIPFNFGINEAPAVSTQGEGTAGSIQTASTSANNSTYNDINSNDQPTTSHNKSKRPKFVVHDTQHMHPDPQTLVISEFVNIEEDSNSDSE